MADEINLNDLESVVKNFGQEGEEVIDTIKRLYSEGTITKDLFDKFSNTIASAAKSFGDLSEASVDARKKLSELFSIDISDLTKVFENSEELFKNYANQAIESNQRVSEAVVESAATILVTFKPAIIENSKLFGSFGDMGAEASTKISNNLENVAELVEKTGIPESSLRSIIKASENVADLETAYVKMQLRSGQAVKNSESGMAELSVRIDDVARGTGMLASEVGPFITTFGSKMPGALNEFSKAANGSRNSLDPIVKMIKIADGIGLSHQDTIDRVTESYAKYDNTVDKTLDNLVKMNSTIQDLGIRQDTMLSFIDSATQGMESMSDATSSVIDLMQSLGKVMRENGVSERGVSNILSGMAQGAKSLDIGQASFINQASGGQGGLAGGFEIELLKQQGNLGEVANRMMKAMEQSGVGSPVTLQNVQDNPALAGQLLQQREMIKEFGLAQNDQDAYRVLEAMQGGAQDKLENALKGLKDPEKETQAAIERGNNIANMQLNSLKTLVNNSNAFSRTVAMEAREGPLGEGLDDAMAGPEGATDISRGGEGKTFTTGVTGDRLTKQDATMEIGGRIAGDIGDTGVVLKKALSSALQDVNDLKQTLKDLPSNVGVQKESSTKREPIEVTGNASVDINITSDGFTDTINKTVDLKLKRAKEGAFTGFEE